MSDPILPKETKKRIYNLAKRLTRMVQGTMALESQGLDTGFQRQMTKKTYKELIEKYKQGVKLDL